MSYLTRLTTPADFERAFNIAHPWLINELKTKWLDEKRITKEFANDTVAAHLQALELAMLVQADEEERSRIGTVEGVFVPQKVLTKKFEKMKDEDIP